MPGTEPTVRRSADMRADDNGQSVERVAQQMIADYGSDAPAFLRERAEQADVIGDVLGAEAWRDIAYEAERLLRA